MKNQSPLLGKLKKLKLPVEDYAIFGSAIMYFHGLKDLGHDIDIIARGKAWDKACKIKAPEIAHSKKGLVVKPFGDEIEVFSEWSLGEWDINELINNACEFEGIKVVGFEEVIKWKQLMGREKDLEHIEIIKNYLEKSS